jgi:NADH:ubiquinone oxidoreductase subunit H
MIFILITLLKILSIVVPLLIAVAYFTIAEEKIMGAIQDGEDLMWWVLWVYYNH